MKYYCEACERLVPPALFRVEGRLLVLKCSRCKVETRCEPEQDEASAAPALPKVTAQVTAQGPVIMLAGSEAEPDPIENEPTRRVAVPAAVLAAIESEAKEARARKEQAKEAAAAKAPEPGVAKAPEPKAPEPVAARAVAPEPVSTAKAPPSRMVMSEAAAANLVVLRLSDVGPRKAAEPTPPPAAAPAPEEAPPARASSVQLRAVPEPTPTAAPRQKDNEDPFIPPPGYCPKCIGGRKEGAVVCPFCGLEYARFRTEEFHGSPALHSTWLGVLELWESKGAHDKVLALASERGELAILGRLYRIRLARYPEDAQAKRGREEVLRLASAGSGLMPSAPPDKRAKMKVAMQGLLVFALVVVAMFIAYKARGMFLGQ